MRKAIKNPLENTRKINASSIGSIINKVSSCSVPEFTLGLQLKEAKEGVEDDFPDSQGNNNNMFFILQN
jgi:hypothetical protein